MRFPCVVGPSDRDTEKSVNNILSIETFVSAVKHRDWAILAEAFPGSDALCASGPEGMFMHEIITPFVSARYARGRRRQSQAHHRTSSPVAESIATWLGVALCEAVYGNSDG